MTRTVMVILALAPWVFLALALLWDRRSRRLAQAVWRSNWESLASAHGMTLKTDEQGESVLQGSASGVDYSLQVVGVPYGWDGLVGLKVSKTPTSAPTKFIAWPGAERPSWVPVLPTKVDLGDSEFGEVFEVWTDDEGVARARLPESVRKALLSIRQSALVYDNGELLVLLGVDPLGVDEHLLSAVKDIVSGVCTA